MFAIDALPVRCCLWGSYASRKLDACNFVGAGFDEESYIPRSTEE